MFSNENACRSLVYCGFAWSVFFFLIFLNKNACPCEGLPHYHNDNPSPIQTEIIRIALKHYGNENQMEWNIIMELKWNQSNDKNCKSVDWLIVWLSACNVPIQLILSRTYKLLKASKIRNEKKNTLKRLRWFHLLNEITKKYKVLKLIWNFIFLYSFFYYIMFHLKMK